MAYQLSIREKAVENKLRKDYFQAYNAEDVLGDIDSLVFLLTGMRGVDFRQAYQKPGDKDLYRIIQ